MEVLASGSTYLPPQVTVLDGLGRTRLTQTEGTADSATDPITALTSYDARGNVASATAPFVASGGTLTAFGTDLADAAGDALDLRRHRPHARGDLRRRRDRAAPHHLDLHRRHGHHRPPVGATTVTAVDAQGRTASFDDGAGGGPTRYSYDRQGRLVALVAQSGTKPSTSTYTYDWLGRRTRTVDPNAASPARPTTPTATW